MRNQCRVSAGHAAGIIATARGLRHLDATEKALHTGDISFEQAQIITRTVSGLDADAAPHAEQILLDNAPGLDIGRLRQLAGEVSYRADLDTAEERERKRWERRHLSFGLTLDDTGLLHGACGDTASFEILHGDLLAGRAGMVALKARLAWYVLAEYGSGSAPGAPCSPLAGSGRPALSAPAGVGLDAKSLQILNLRI